jgi:hypothetical protein
VYRNDINGNSVEAERRVIETRVQGSTTVTETAVERPTLNGSFEVTGKSTQVAEKTPAGENVSNSDYRRAQSGEFYEAFRRVTQATKSGSQTTVQGAEYEIGATGKMELARQSVAITSKGSDGASVTELSLYDRAADGRSQAHDAPLQIKEQQTIERIPGPGGALTEVVTARRPTLADPTSLGEPRKISETVCRGKCSDEKP